MVPPELFVFNRVVARDAESGATAVLFVCLPN